MENNNLDIWRIDLDSKDVTIKQCISTLSQDERQKATRYVFKQDQRRYIVGRYCMRQILSSYLNMQAPDLKFSYNLYGKPFINDSTLAFNLSHSHDRAILGVSHHGPIGVDIEKDSIDRDLISLSKQIFSAQEYASFISLDETMQKKAFYRSWTRKEAFVKCIGLGFSCDVKRIFDNSIISDEVIYAEDKQLPAISDNYTIYTLETGMPDYIASAVGQSVPQNVHYLNFTFI